MAEALIWEFKSTQNAHAHTFPDCKIRRNAEHSEQVPVRLLYPEPSHIFCQKSIYWKIKRSFKIDYRNYFCAHKPKFYSECQDWGLRGREKNMWANKFSFAFVSKAPPLPTSCWWNLYATPSRILSLPQFQFEFSHIICSICRIRDGSWYKGFISTHLGCSITPLWFHNMEVREPFQIPPAETFIMQQALTHFHFHSTSTLHPHTLPTPLPTPFQFVSKPWINRPLPSTCAPSPPVLYINII